MLLLRVTTLLLIITGLVFSGTSLSAEKNRDDAIDDVVAVQRQISAYAKKLPEVMIDKMTREEMKFVMDTNFAFRLSLNKSNHLSRIAYNLHSCGDDELDCKTLLLERCVKLKKRVNEELVGYIENIASYRKILDSHIISENIEQVIDIENSLLLRINKLCK